MNNDNPNNDEMRVIADSKAKKPYKAPSFRFDSVFEVSALSCGKVSTQGQCTIKSKS
jgi:hypothetical protein